MSPTGRRRPALPLQSTRRPFTRRKRQHRGEASRRAPPHLRVGGAAVPGVVPHPIRLNPLPCLSCRIPSRGYECRNCGQVCCVQCLPQMVGGRCPRCGERLVPQRACFICGLITGWGVGQPAELDERCSKCGLNFCGECAKRLAPRSYLRFFTGRICPSCGGTIAGRAASRVIGASHQQDD
jgi:hypothetical protein